MLEVKDVFASYGGIKALHGVSLRVDPGECVAVLGTNGAGKSTLLKTISAMHKIDSGSITFNGQPIPGQSYQLVQLGISHVPEGRQIFADLTVHQNLMVGAFQRKDRSAIERDLEMIFEYFPRLKERINQYGGLLSGGEQQMLAISRGLMARPSLIMLDEPSLGLAPIVVNQIFEILQEINRAGTTILIVEQNAYKALTLAHRGYLMTTGSIERSGDARELLEDGKLTQAYLGKGTRKGV